MAAPSIRPRAAFDIETVGWDRFYCGALLFDGRMRTFRQDQEADLAAAILAVGEGDVLAHNGGRFDFLWLIDAWIRFGLWRDGMTINVAESGASIVSMRVRGPGLNLTFRDTYRMFPVSLARIGGKSEVGLACSMERAECAEQARIQRANGAPAVGCGGYCAIRDDLSPVERGRVLDYCAQDTRALWDGAHRLIAFAREIGLVLGGTTGATAWNTARAWGLVEPTALSHREWIWLRAGYFGGRVGLFQATAAEGWHYDITSSYPHQCTQPLPCGAPTFRFTEREARDAFAAGLPGIYEARVSVPECLIPPLPLRVKQDGERRNAYPTGTFAGAWALPELLHAEQHGATIEPLAAATFPEERAIFEPLMRYLIGLRLKFGKTTAEGALIKLWANSLYGKFAQEPRAWRLMIVRSGMDVPEGSRPVNMAGTAWLVPVQGVPALPESSHVEKAAYITARGRTQLHTMLTARGGTDAVYADTDSCFATAPRGEADGVRAGLGGWADEGRFYDFAAIGPKLYRYDQGEERVPVLRAKGIAIPRMLDRLAAEREWRRIAAGEQIQRAAGVLSLRHALRGPSMFAAKVSSRSTTGAVSYGDRIPDGAGSRPPRACEVTPAALTFEWSAHA